MKIQQIPDSSEKNDDKLYFFFREKSLDAAGGSIPSVLSRVGRVCLVRHPPCAVGSVSAVSSLTPVASCGDSPCALALNRYNTTVKGRLIILISVLFLSLLLRMMMEVKGHW